MKSFRLPICIHAVSHITGELNLDVSAGYRGNNGRYWRPFLCSVHTKIVTCSLMLGQ